MNNGERIKYYSLNIENSKPEVDEGLINSEDADYHGTDGNSIEFSNNILDFGDDYYNNITSVRSKYDEMLNAFSETELNEERKNEIANEIYQQMMENHGSDETERSAVLEYLEYASYDKGIINKVINKVNNSEHLSGTNIQISEIE